MRDCVSVNGRGRETQALAPQNACPEELDSVSILAEGAIALSVTHSGGALFAS